MTGLRDILERHVSSGSLPGAVGLVARGDRVEVEAVGTADIEGTAPMVRDSIFRIASLTKPVTAAAVMMLVEEGRFALEEPVEPWLPELASRVVVRTPASPVDDVVPAARPITVFDLLTFRAGYGFPSDFSLPAVGLLVSELKQGPPQPQHIAEPDAWMKALSRIPLLYQPGEAWLYNTCSDILGVLIARVSGQSLPEFLAERVFEPLGMADTGFAVPPADLGRFTSYYRGDDGALELADAPHGQWSSVPAFPSATGGLVGTADDWYAFGRMMLAQGALEGERGRLLSAQSVRQMTTDWLTPAQRSGGELFLEGQGWGFGGSVDVTARDPWNVPGRYGWVGGTGTAAHITPATGAVSVLLTQREMTGPTPPAVMRDFWTYAAGA
ncbi:MULTISPECIES: serine hydrolase domain-containing protein [unclassified Streptomyces]|uniref:Serine hydrolase domain-containing protein n=1 Tax=Streptomyces sp. R33 TaxID=3238629 RepID=A0AB39XY70_9ACTN|nr:MULTISPECIES: serine hydrolase domain-containing protein [unclassified Streptomyces]KOY54245.1 beta-lactamase [Streptomyces sp. XY332]THA40130.1 class A beta-lactamase-related serine hydrolase [Streptomyces sp. A1547]